MFGKMCVLGAEPDLEIAGVLLMKGTDIPQFCIDHPQFEYYRARKMVMEDPKEKQLIKEFFASEDGVGTCMGLPVVASLWHK